MSDTTAMESSSGTAPVTGASRTTCNAQRVFLSIRKV
jgi:hypothetical protein